MTEQSGGRNSGGAGSAVQELPVDRLIEEAQNLLAAVGEKALTRVADKVGGVTERLGEYVESGAGPGLTAALTGGRSLGGGASAVGGVLKAGLTQVKEKVKNAVGGGEKGEDSKDNEIKAINIVESVDVGVPVSVAYNQWTQFEDFPSFMKKVESVKKKSETELAWKAQIFLSHRTWESEVIDQVPDERIVWRSHGAKGHVDGAVTFHELTPDLTKILLVLEYHPQGLFERTGNLWRAQGRRARLELKHFQRHLMTKTVLHPEDIHGWRGEVRDGEIVSEDEDEGEYEEEPEEEAEGRHEASREPEGNDEEEYDEGPEDEEEAGGDEEPEAEPGEGNEDNEEEEGNKEETEDEERPQRPRHSSTAKAR
ncbi:MAG: SRPBCC family protein [Streptomycetaceae bacterium]|nr:SRPBCC family protein [Streptomycetaceae bacterium]